MIRRTLVVAAAFAAATAAPATAKHRVAHFKVKVRAVQVVDWKQDFTATTCNGGVAELTGGGRAEVHLHTPALQPVVARRMRTGAVVLSVRGRGALPIAGTLSRQGTTASREIKPGTGSCGGLAPVRWTQSNPSTDMMLRSKNVFSCDEKNPATYELFWVLLRS